MCEDSLKDNNEKMPRVHPLMVVNQRVIVKLETTLRLHFEDKPYKMLTSINAIWLKKNGITVCPDIAVICNLKDELPKLPYLIIDVLPYENQSHIRLVKYVAYMEAGVQEYWIVNPNLMAIEIYTLLNGEYKQVAIYKGYEYATSHIFPGLIVCLADLNIMNCE